MQIKFQRNKKGKVNRVAISDGTNTFILKPLAKMPAVSTLIIDAIKMINHIKKLPAGKKS